MSNLVFHRDIFTEDEDCRLKRAPSFVAHEYFGGGKSTTTSQSVSIPPEVLARYNAVNTRAESVAQTPFQQYSSDPSAFVAPLNQTQQAGIENTTANANAAQPYYDAASQFAFAGASPTNVGQLNDQDIGRYMNPFVNSVVAPAAQLLDQQQQAQMSGQTGNAIKSGAFGGDRAGIAAANLAGQQSLSFANAINPLFSQAYDRGLQTAGQQQQFNLGQQQANLGRFSQAGQQLGGLGTGAQTAALQGAQAQLAAGQVGQQTDQAGRSALYNQFLQQQGYPFQTAQFLANIAEGTGSLSGSTTTTTQPAPFFSDERLKDDVENIGETYDGQKIIKFRYKGSPHTQIGLSAQNVEKHHPDAVGLAGGYKTVDYDAATKRAAERGHFYGGGLASQGGAVDMQSMGEGFAEGGAPGLAIFGMPGSQNTNAGLAAALVAGTPAHAWKLTQPMTAPRAATPELSQIAQGIAGGNDIVKTLGTAGESLGKAKDWWNGKTAARGGLIGYAQGGDVDDANPYDDPAVAPGNVPKALNIPNDQSHYTLGGGGKQGGSGGGGGQQQSGLGQIASGVKDIATIGTAASTIMDFLPFLFLKNGGAVRQGLARGGVPEDYSAEDGDLIAPGGQEAAFTRNPTFAEVSPVVVDEAKKQGLNPGVVLNIVKAEYGNGSKYVGDDGSSGSPLQLHYGNTSSMYPHPGLGNAFTKKTGLDARDPAHWEGATRFGIQKMAEQGLTPWLTSMKKLGYAPDSAHTGQGGLGAISRASSNQVARADTDAAPQSGVGAAPSFNIGPPSEGLAKKFEENKNWLIPLMSGLGKMASSNSRYLGSAVLQGLGGAAESYAGLQKDQAGVGQTESVTGFNRAQTASTMAEITRKNYESTIVTTADGRPMLKSVWLIAYLKDPNNAPKLLGGNESAIATAAANAGISGTAQRGPVPVPKVGEPLPNADGETTAATPPSKVTNAPPTTPQPPSTTQPMFAPSAEEVAAEKKRLTSLYATGYDAATAPQPKAYSDQYDSAQRAQDQKQLAVPLVNALSNLPKTGLQSSGPQQQALAPVVSYLQGLARTLGVDASSLTSQLLTSQDTASQEEVNKLVSQMQSKAVSSAGQTAYSAFRDVARGIPGILNSPAGQAKLIPQILTNVQRDIDRNEYMTAHLNEITKGNPLIQGVATMAGGAQAGKAFDDKFGNDFYQNERNALEKMYDAPVTDTKTGKTTSVMALISSGTPLPVELKTQLEKKYGQNILRYFGVK